ncbi:MAG: hypothetical protein KF703_17680 [Actinobacteria bacterium]|nr:hypothetical protein [Actinomycetota bacterium]
MAAPTGARSPRPGPARAGPARAGPARPGASGPSTDRLVRRLSGWRRWVTIATIAGFGVLPALAALGAWRAGWQPTGDVAIIGLRSRDAWTLHPPLVGQPTTGSSYAGISSFHPGPAEFWLLGPWVRLFGPALGMLLGTAAINGAALAGVMWTAFRRGGPVLLGFVALGVAALVRSVGAGTLYDPFNSEIATYALLLTVLAAWSVAAGDRRLLPMLAAAASLAAQTHVSGAVAVAPVVGLTVGVLVVQVRAGRWSPAREQRWLGGAAAVLAVAWLPVLVREVTGPSNLWALWRTSRAPHPQIGLAFAVERLLGSLALPPLFVWTPPDLVFVGTASTAGILVAALVAGGTAALVLVLRAEPRGRGTGFLAACVGLVALASVWTTASAPPFSAIRSDVTRATWVVSLLVWLTAAWAGWQLLGAERRRRAAPFVLPVAAGLALVLAVVALATTHLEDQRDGRVMSAVDLASGRAIRNVPDGSYLVTLDGETAVFTVGPGVALRLEDAGRTVLFGRGPFGEAYGDHRTPEDPKPDGHLRITTAASPQPKAGERLVAEAPLPAPSTDSIYVFLAP